jgi:circadian clock protein KaiB
MNQQNDPGDEPHPTTVARDPECYLLRLYVAGMTAHSRQSIQNLVDFCEEHLKDVYKIEVVDIYQHPEKTFEDKVMAAPTLIKELPPPVRRIIGNLSDNQKILRGLDIIPLTTACEETWSERP